MKEQVTQIRRDVSQQLRRILEERTLTTHFQPIFGFREGAVVAHEALVRGPEGSLIQTPAELFAAATRVIEAEYEWPFQSHAAMGPACALVEIKDGKVTCWSGTQKSHFLQQGVAATLGVGSDLPHQEMPRGHRRVARVLAEDAGRQGEPPQDGDSGGPDEGGPLRAVAPLGQGPGDGFARMMIGEAGEVFEAHASTLTTPRRIWSSSIDSNRALKLPSPSPHCPCAG